MPHSEVEFIVQILRPSLDWRAWLLVPEFSRRVADFAQETDPTLLPMTARLLQDFYAGFAAAGSEVLGLVVMDVARTEPVGHIAASIESVRGEKYVYIHQWKKDTPRIPREIDDLCVQILDEWGAAHGASHLRAVTLSESRARLIERYGFNSSSGPVVVREVQHGR